MADKSAEVLMAMNTSERQRNAGFSVIELIIAMVIFAVLVSLAMPGFVRWIGDVRISSQAERIYTALQQARGEALKRNSVVRFQFVSNLAATCTIPAASPANSGTTWVVSHGDPTTSCDLTADLAAADSTNNEPYATPPVILMAGFADQVTTIQTAITVTATGVTTASIDPVVCFGGTGRLLRVANANITSNTGAAVSLGECTTTSNPAVTAAASVVVDVSNPTAGSCFSDATTPPSGFSATGTVRCRQIRVSPWGEVRTCDPGLSAAKHANDPRVCS